MKIRYILAATAAAAVLAVSAGAENPVEDIVDGVVTGAEDIVDGVGDAAEDIADGSDDMTENTGEASQSSTTAASANPDVDNIPEAGAPNPGTGLTLGFAAAGLAAAGTTAALAIKRRK